MTKIPEQMADDYAACWTSEQLCELKDAIGMLVNKWQQEAFLAGYEAASDKYLEQIRHLEMELQQAKLSAMKLEAER